jgi:quercetin dioxygenase-like cupin family protein
VLDPKRYKVEFENEQISVLRISYGSYEKSPMHEHPDGQIVYLTEHPCQNNASKWKALEERGKAGQTLWRQGQKHATENLGDKPFWAILVEMD